jgi:adenosine deaminase
LKDPAPTPTVELHVHLEGAIQPATLLALAQRNRVALPATTEHGLREWYRFTDFAHFVQVYLTISDCIRTPDDIEHIARDFLAGQAAQHIIYTEVTYTAFTHYHFKQIPFHEQLAALNRARQWAETEHNTTMRYIIDIPGTIAPEDGMLVAEWAIEGMSDGVVALGLSGPEADHHPTTFHRAFDRARAAGLPAVPHAGEQAGPTSIWNALHLLHPTRIGHGIRCLEDPTLVAELRARQIPLDICPSSNVCLGFVPTLAAHPLPRLLDAGLYITLNTDDPPLFNTTLTNEYTQVAHTFGLTSDDMARLARNAEQAALIPVTSDE